MYKYNLNHIVFGIINAIVNKLLESKWRPSSSRDSGSQSQVRHRLRQLFFIYGFGPLKLLDQTPPCLYVGLPSTCYITVHDVVSRLSSFAHYLQIHHRICQCFACYDWQTVITVYTLYTVSKNVPPL